MKAKIDNLKSHIEFILGTGGVHEYPAKIITGAIIDLLKEEGLISDDKTISDESDTCADEGADED